MNSEARSFYWLFTLRLISRAEVAAWADGYIASGIDNPALFDLSTCSQLDDNAIMQCLTDLSPGYNQDLVETALLNKLIEYYSNIDYGNVVNLSLLSDYKNIPDLTDDVRIAIAWLVDDLVLSRDGIKLFSKSESQSIVSELNKLIAN